MIFGRKNNRKPASRTQDSAENSVEPIDCERLAKCIAKAIADENDQRAKAYSMTREWIKYLTWLLLALLIVLMASLGIGCFIFSFKTLKTTFSHNTLDKTDIVMLAKGLISLIFSLIFSSVAFISVFASKEFDKETDRQFVMSVFSSMISLVALIVAFAALYRG